LKFALINGDKAEATKGARGFCPSCGSELIARCGDVKVNHWAHKGNRNCDPWWENETDWHRSWKGKFPIEWQEVIHFDESGEKHIADVKTESGCVLEFQHSYLNPEERRSRNAFYSKLVWVVDGTRRKTDKSQFQRILDENTTVIREPLIKRVHFPDECRLLKEWNDSNALVFFDFQEAKDSEQSMLWFLFPKISSGDTYLSPFSQVKFIELHNNNKFDELVQNIILPIHKELARNKQIEHANNMHSHPNRLSGSDWIRIGRQRRL
jgi:competence CoiA-like predicted nuclease